MRPWVTVYMDQNQRFRKTWLEQNADSAFSWFESLILAHVNKRLFQNADFE